MLPSIARQIFRRCLFALLLLGAWGAPARAGQGFFVILENASKEPARVETRVYHNWHPKDFRPPLSVAPGETRTYYTEACDAWGPGNDGPFLSCVEYPPTHLVRMDVYLYAGQTWLGELTIINDDFYASPPEVRCSNWGNFNVKSRPKKQGRQYVVRIKVLANTFTCE